MNSNQRFNIDEFTSGATGQPTTKVDTKATTTATKETGVVVIPPNFVEFFETTFSVVNKCKLSVLRMLIFKNHRENRKLD